MKDEKFDRLKYGIKRYGFVSDFMKEYNSLRMQIRYDEDDDFFNRWLIPMTDPVVLRDRKIMELLR